MTTKPLPKLSEIIDQLAQADHGVILTMGKGGVGKTTVAATVAIALADRGHKVHLTTTDPAAHIMAAIGEEAVSNLMVSRIDPAVEVARYSAEVLSRAGSGLDEQGRKLLEEICVRHVRKRSPCSVPLPKLLQREKSSLSCSILRRRAIRFCF